MGVLNTIRKFGRSVQRDPIAEAIALVTEHTAADAEQAWSDYRGLVQSLSRGADIDSKNLADVMGGLKISEDRLRADVDVVKKHSSYCAYLGDYVGRRAELHAELEDTAAKRGALEIERDELKAHWYELDGQLLSLVNTNIEREKLESKNPRLFGRPVEVEVESEPYLVRATRLAHAPSGEV